MYWVIIIICIDVITPAIFCFDTFFIVSLFDILSDALIWYPIWYPIWSDILIWYSDILIPYAYLRPLNNALILHQVCACYHSTINFFFPLFQQ